LASGGTIDLTCRCRYDDAEIKNHRGSGECNGVIQKHLTIARTDAKGDASLLVDEQQCALLRLEQGCGAMAIAAR
jgi:hypothetical protein